jgi:HEPN domain-containing protein
MPATESERWRSQAAFDLEDARYCADGGRYAPACFFSHQAAEKAVTAYLYARGAEQVWGHGLADLCEDAMAFDASFDLVKSSAMHLDTHYLGARYPSGIPAGVPSEAYDDTDANRAIAIAEEVLRFVDERLASLASGAS